MTKSNTPVSIEDRRAARLAQLPDSLSTEQLRRRSVGRMRYAMTQLVEGNVDQVQDWLDEIAVVDGAKAALDSYIKLMEFAVPKLSRAEVVTENDGVTKKAQLTMEDLQNMLLEMRTLEGQATHVTTPESEST